MKLHGKEERSKVRKEERKKIVKTFFWLTLSLKIVFSFKQIKIILKLFCIVLGNLTLICADVVALNWEHFLSLNQKNIFRASCKMTEAPATNSVQYNVAWIKSPVITGKIITINNSIIFYDWNTTFIMEMDSQGGGCCESWADKVHNSPEFNSGVLCVVGFRLTLEKERLVLFKSK